MRIGNWLGGSVIWALAATMSMAAGAGTAEHVTTVPLGGSLDGQSGDHYYGVYVPTRFGGELKVKTTRGSGRRAQGTRRARPDVNGQDIGFDQQGWYTFKVEGAKKPYTVETSFVQVGQSTKKPWNFYYWPTKADSIHEPWAGGNARVDTMTVNGDDQLIATPGGYIPPGQWTSSWPGPTGCSKPCRQPGDDATWFPNLYDDLTWVGPGQGARRPDHPLPDPVAPAEVRPALRHVGATVGGGVQPEQGYLAMARPLPGRCGRLDPLERAGARALDGHDPRRAQGPLGRAG